MKQEHMGFRVGDKIKLVESDDKGLIDKIGKVGVIELIDDAGQLWTSIAGIALLPEYDTIEKLS